MVLVFDEAESLFGKRTESKSARDRYANLDTSFLLQQIESHPGLVIMTTNRPDQIDETFKERVSWSIKPGLPNLESRDSIELDQTGEILSGQYYVEEVQHNFGETQYQEKFDTDRSTSED